MFAIKFTDMLVPEGTFQSWELVHVDQHLWQHKDCYDSEWLEEASEVHKERPEQECYQPTFLEAAVVGLVEDNP